MKKSKKIKLHQFCLALVVSLWTTCSLGQKVFMGSVDPSLKVDSIEFRYSGDVLGMGRIYSEAPTHYARLESGSFQIDLPETPGPSYLLIIPPSGTLQAEKLFRPLSYGPFLMGKGDTLDLRVSGSRISPGPASTPACLLQMQAISLDEERLEEMVRIRVRYNQNDTVGLAQRTRPFLDEIRSAYLGWEAALMENFERYLPMLDPEFARVLRYEQIGRLRNRELGGFRYLVELGPDAARPVAARYYMDSQIGREQDYARSYEGNSPEFASYLNMKAVTDLLVAYSMVQGRMSVEFPPVLDIIARRYQGRTFDEVAFSAFLDRGARKYMDPRTFSVLSSKIGEPQRREYVLKQRSRTSPGNPFFEFEMVDQDGQLVRNSDLEGKVVVYDFWYTGCIGCAVLHKAMRPVKDRFRGNPNVRFVNISVDLDEQRWKSSVTSGTYSSEGDINLWVGPGKDRAIVRHLGINSYPTQVIVDGNNRVVAMNPPDVRTSSQVPGFIEMVERAIEPKM
jgi:thiol-disulfide isomerase/thioredoxin